MLLYNNLIKNLLVIKAKNVILIEICINIALNLPQRGRKTQQEGAANPGQRGSAFNPAKASLELKTGLLLLGCGVVAESEAKSLTLLYNKASS